ncbi:hypothetical protein [Pseudomonas benzenivorans]|uniref:Uncharacterized protein n=1 Tax=Pseudomonas benzenivorans TaxID=556533 RepID=A0ABY5HA01_9PSED|nr:hypothetical protein [Pseudomonas benzenivorans]UTW08677.1 hypothetical protein KDW96_05005 [Pseudomonas benzenivorans]
MNVKNLLGFCLLFAMAGGWLSPVSADHRHTHEHEKWKDEFWDGPCRVKREYDHGDYKEEVKCPDGHGAYWRPGRWKDQYWEHGCRVKIDAKHDEFKKEVKCDHDDD